MSAQQLAKKPQHAVPLLPENIAKDFGIVDLLQEEVNKSGELYLKVAFWRVLLRLPQHCADMVPHGAPGTAEGTKTILARLLAYSEMLILEGKEEGGLSKEKHGVTEQTIRENIQWLREKLVVLELQLTEARKKNILHSFSAAA